MRRLRHVRARLSETGHHARHLMQPRDYRETMGGRFSSSCAIRTRASDIWVGYNGGPDPACMQAVLSEEQRRLYDALECYIDRQPAFLNALNPIPRDASAPTLAQEMMEAARLAGTGPMAAVAGLFAQYMARSARSAGATDVIVENGGDLFCDCRSDLLVSVLAGESRLSGRLAVRLRAEQMPLSVCTSSGTVGHSLSFGVADAVLVMGTSGARSDALATAIGNQVRRDSDLAALLDRTFPDSGAVGMLIIRGEDIAAIGDLKLERAK